MDCPPLNFVEVNSLEEFFKSGANGMLNGLAGTVNAFNGIIKALFNIPISNDVLSDAVTAAGVSLTSLFLCMEFFSQITQKWFERMEDAIQLGIKLVVAKIIIENSTSITGGIVSYFRSLGSASLDSGLSAISSSLTAGGLPSKAGPFGLGYIAVMIGLLILIILAVIVLSMVAIEVAGIVFEIGIHMAVGPIALSTLCNSTFRSTGLSYIKSLSAVCLQTTVIGAICKVYTAVLPQLTSVDLGAEIFNGGGGTLGALVFGYASPLLGLVVFCVTIKKSSDITKRMFGA